MRPRAVIQDEDDNAVILRCLEGDVNAFGVLVERYQGPVYNVACRMVRDREDAREIAQDVFLRAFRALPSFDRSLRFFSWLYRIAVNQSINFLESRRPLDPIPADFPSTAQSPEMLCEAGETMRHLEEALTRLSPDHRAVIVLRHVAQLSYAEIAGVLDVPERTVRSRLFEARRNLRDLLTRRGHGAVR